MAKHILDVVSFDTHAEIPSTLTEGQLVFCKEHWALHYWGATQLEEPSNMGGGTHPDLAAHNTLGLASTHAHPYAADNHSHGGGAPIDAWPVGSVFIAVVSTSPATLLGGGTWVAFGVGRMLVGRDSGDVDFDTAEETGGAKTVTLTEAQIPSHTHVQNAHNHVVTSQTAATGSATSYEHGTLDTSSTENEATEVTANATAVNQNTGGGLAHPNLPPYIVVYMWKRTA